MSVDGLLVIDKPVGPTSHDIVARVRRIVGESRVGHSGTLDPMASGVLPLVLGRATRLVRFLDADDKCYEATVRLGFSTDTRDASGLMVGAPYTGPMPARQTVDRALDPFRGTFLQQPPAFSAKKIGGRRSYRLARAHARTTAPTVLSDAPATAVPPALPVPVTVTARSIDILSAESDLVTMQIACSSGFYVRSLAHDVGEALGTGAHLVALRRTQASGFSLARAIPLDVLEDGAEGRARAFGAVVPIAAMLPGLQAITLTEPGADRASRGCRLGPGDVMATSDPSSPSHYFRLLDQDGRLLGIGEETHPGLLHPVVVLM